MNEENLQARGALPVHQYPGTLFSHIDPEISDDE
jgi:hypothetical protein